MRFRRVGTGVLASRPARPLGPAVGAVLLLAPLLVSAKGTPATAPLTPQPLPAEPAAASAGRGHVVKGYGELALSFEANTGQTDPQVAFLARGEGYALFLTPGEAVLRLRAGESNEDAVVRLRCEGGNRSPRVSGLDPEPGRSNYFIGNDPSRWRTNVPHYARVRYEAVYPGIDLVYYGRQRQLEFDFVVQPGSDPRQIDLDFEGADRLEVDAEGDLIVHVGGSSLRQHEPIAYQERDGARQPVAASYVVEGRQHASFRLSDYDHERPLVIDPVLVYSTYLGGSAGDYATAVAVDGAGKAYIAGSTYSTDFPTVNPIDPSPAAEDIFVAKLDTTGSALVYATYLGGTYGDSASGIAVDSAGNAYVTGGTGSSDFPRVNPVQSTCPDVGSGDAFVLKLSATGSALVYSTCLGGWGSDGGAGIAVDASGSAYVIGSTGSVDFPTAKALQPVKKGDADVFVTKLTPTGSALAYSTYLGGTRADNGKGIAVDASGAAYLTGYTTSTDFPTANPLQPKFGGSLWDAFVAKLNPAGSTLAYSTYLGGVNDDQSYAIAVDRSGNAYVTGNTTSGNFPTVNAFQPSLSCCGRDAFVSRLNASGSALVYSTYLGGAGSEYGYGIAVDASGSAYIAGDTDSGSWNPFPTLNPLQPFGGANDAFVTRLAPSGSALVFSTFLGGSGQESASGIAVDVAGDAYVVGWTGSTDFPTANPLQVAKAGFNDAFVSKIWFRADVSIGDATVVEGDTGTSSAVFTVTLSEPRAATVIVGYATGDGTAVAGSDYVATSGSISVPPGAMSGTIAIPVLGDLAYEPDETFTVKLSSASLPIARQQAQGTIVNDDNVPQILVEDCAVLEGNTGTAPCDFHVSLSNPSSAAVTVGYATVAGTAAADTDYVPVSGTLTFPPFTSGLQDVVVPVLGDASVEGDETFVLNLSIVYGVTLPQSQATGTIVDDDAPPLSSTESSAGGCQVYDLGPPTPGVDLFRIGQADRSSYEVVVDATTGDAVPLTLERLSADNATVIDTATAVGAGPSLSLRWRNKLPVGLSNEHLRVRTAGCAGGCSADDSYRLCIYDTTYRVPRFNNSASQTTFLALDNTTGATVNGDAYFYSGEGAFLFDQPFTLPPHGGTVINTSTIQALDGRSGSITVASDAPYGTLAGKAVAIEPATGYAFDTPLAPVTR